MPYGQDMAKSGGGAGVGFLVLLAMGFGILVIGDGAESAAGTGLGGLLLGLAVLYGIVLMTGIHKKDQ